ncbi:PrpF domain-containing protein [Streptomyces sp. SBR177]
MVAGAATVGGPARPVTVRAVTTGDTVRCTPEGDGAYTLAFLRPPTAPGTLPTGRPVDVLDGVPVTLIRYGNPYVLVDARHVPAAAPVPEGPLQGRLLELRAHAARLLGHPPHSPLPKIAVFSRGGGTRTGGTVTARALTVGGWHPRLALTGAAAFAAAGAIDGTVLAGPVTRIRTPGGTVTVSADAGRVRVHHKRARVLDRLQLPGVSTQRRERAPVSPGIRRLTSVTLNYDRQSVSVGIRGESRHT